MTGNAARAALERVKRMTLTGLAWEYIHAQEAGDLLRTMAAGYELVLRACLREAGLGRW